MNAHFRYSNGRMNLQNLYDYNRSKPLLLGRILEPENTQRRKQILTVLS